jgi:hypothetical protein
MAADPKDRLNAPAPLPLPYASGAKRRPLVAFVNGTLEVRGDVFVLLLSGVFGAILALVVWYLLRQ